MGRDEVKEVDVLISIAQSLKRLVELKEKELDRG